MAWRVADFGLLVLWLSSPTITLYLSLITMSPGLNSSPYRLGVVFILGHWFHQLRHFLVQSRSYLLSTKQSLLLILLKQRIEHYLMGPSSMSVCPPTDFTSVFIQKMAKSGWSPPTFRTRLANMSPRLRPFLKMFNGAVTILSCWLGKMRFIW